MKNEMAITGIPGQLTERALVLEARIPFRKWTAIGRFLRQVHQCSQWWLGDWCNYGEAAYGEKYAQAIEETNFDYGTLRNYASIAGKFPQPSRMFKLSFTHYVLVATLGGLDVASRMLELAEKNGWTSKELKEKVGEVKAAGKLADGTLWKQCPQCKGKGKVKNR